MTPETAAAALDVLLDELAERIARRLRTGGGPGMLDQTVSPLGRHHNAATRARLRRGESGAAIVGRRHLLSVEALAEELARYTAKRRAPSQVSDVQAELERELRLVRGQR